MAFERYLDKGSEESLMREVSQLSSSQTSLDISKNRLDKRSNEFFAIFFPNIPPFIKMLKMQQNIPFKTELQKLLNSLPLLPRNITSLDLSRNMLDHKTDEELAELFAIYLPSHIEEIILTDKTILIHEFWTKRLLAQIENLRIKDLPFHPITPPVTFDEIRTNRTLSLLEKSREPLAFLLCSLLLEGYIENTAEEPTDLALYMEKRTHDAISFYNKASLQNSQIKVPAEFLLWHLRTNTSFLSVQKRLAEYDLNPIAILPTYQKSSKPQSVIMRLPRTRYNFFSYPERNASLSAESENSRVSSDFEPPYSSIGLQ